MGQDWKPEQGNCLVVFKFRLVTAYLFLFLPKTSKTASVLNKDKHAKPSLFN